MPKLNKVERELLAETFPNAWAVFQTMQHDIQNLETELKAARASLKRIESATIVDNLARARGKR